VSNQKTKDNSTNYQKFFFETEKSGQEYEIRDKDSNDDVTQTDAVDH
jgi:hypothetical protein